MRVELVGAERVDDCFAAAIFAIDGKWFWSVRRGGEKVESRLVAKGFANSLEDGISFAMAAAREAGEEHPQAEALLRRGSEGVNVAQSFDPVHMGC